MLREYTHANFNSPIVVSMDLVFAVYYSAAHKATHLLSNGGAIIPITENLDKVKTDLLTYKQSKETIND